MANQVSITAELRGNLAQALKDVTAQLNGVKAALKNVQAQGSVSGKGFAAVGAIGTTIKAAFASIKAFLPALQTLKKGLDVVDNGFRGFFSSIRNGFSSIVSSVLNFKVFFVAALAGLGINKLISELTETAERFNEIAKLSRRLNVSTEFFSALVFGARQVNVSADALEISLRQISANLGKNLRDASIEVRAVLNEIGFDFQKAAERGDSFEKQLADIVDLIKFLPDNQKRLDAFRQLFGEVGPKLANLFEDGSVSIRKYIAESKKLNDNLGEETATRIEKLVGAFRNMSAALEGIRLEILDALAPALTDLTDRFTGLLAVVPKFAKAFGEDLKKAFGILTDADMKSIEDYKNTLRSFGANESEVFGKGNQFEQELKTQATRRIMNLFKAIGNVAFVAVKEVLKALFTVIITSVAVLFDALWPKLKEKINQGLRVALDVDTKVGNLADILGLEKPLDQQVALVKEKVDEIKKAIADANLGEALKITPVDNGPGAGSPSFGPGNIGINREGLLNLKNSAFFRDNNNRIRTDLFATDLTGMLAGMAAGSKDKANTLTLADYAQRIVDTIDRAFSPQARGDELSIVEKARQELFAKLQELSKGDAAELARLLKIQEQAAKNTQDKTAKALQEGLQEINRVSTGAFEEGGKALSEALAQLQGAANDILPNIAAEIEARRPGVGSGQSSNAAVGAQAQEDLQKLLADNARAFDVQLDKEKQLFAARRLRAIGLDNEADTLDRIRVNTDERRSAERDIQGITKAIAEAENIDKIAFLAQRLSFAQKTYDILVKTQKLEEAVLEVRNKSARIEQTVARINQQTANATERLNIQRLVGNLRIEQQRELLVEVQKAAVAALEDQRAAEIANLEVLRAQGLEGTNIFEDYKEKVDNLTLSIQGLQASIEILGRTSGEVFSASLKEFLDNAGDLKRVAEDLASTVGTAMTDGLVNTLEDVVFNSANAAIAFRKFAASVLIDIAKIILKALIARFLLAALGLGGATEGAQLSGLGSQSVGLAYSGGRVGNRSARRNYAGGGMVGGSFRDRDQTLLMGRKGEYMLNPDAVDYYSANVLDKMNKRMIPKDAFSRAINPRLDATERKSDMTSGGNGATVVQPVMVADGNTMNRLLTGGSNELISFLGDNRGKIRSVLGIRG